MGRKQRRRRNRAREEGGSGKQKEESCEIRKKPAPKKPAKKKKKPASKPKKPALNPNLFRQCGGQTQAQAQAPSPSQGGFEPAALPPHTARGGGGPTRPTHKPGTDVGNG